MRAKRAELVLLIGGEGVAENLKQVVADIDAWDSGEQARLYQMMARLMTQFRQFEEAQKYFDQALALNPNDLPTRLQMFELAFAQGDDEAMKAAQAEIEQVLGTKEDSAWWYTEAKRLIMQYEKADRDPALLEKCEELAGKILKKRPEWHEAYLLQGQIDFAQGQTAEAAVAFRKAMELGQADVNSLRMFAQSLVLNNEVTEGRRILDMIPLPIRQNQIGRFSAEVMSLTGNHAEALETAGGLIEQNPEDSDLQSWYATLLKRAGKDSDAETALQKAIQLNPELPQNWLRLIGYYAAAGRVEDAEKALAQAEQAVSEDSLAILKTSAYQQMGRPEEAEKHLLDAYNADPENPAMARLVASFYLVSGYQAADRVEKGTPYLNQLLKLGDLAERTPNQETHLRWARRQAARVLARSGEYAKVKQAENLIQANAVNGQLELSDRIQLAEILVARHDPESRLRAIDLLEEIQDTDLLTAQGSLQLAKLYKMTNQWDLADQQMLRTVGKFGQESPGVWTAYVDMLIERGDRGYRSAYRDAEKHMEKLLKLRPNDPSTLALYVRLFDRLDRKRKARELLALALGPLDKLTTNDLGKIQLIGSLFAQLGDLNNAEVLYQKHYQLARNLPSIERLATFLGQYRDVEEAFRLDRDLAERAADRPRTGDPRCPANAAVSPRRNRRQ